MTKPTRFTIVGGDSKFDLLLQLSLIGRKVEHEGIRFRVLAEDLRHEQDMRFKVNGITSMDRAGDEWFVTGYCLGETPTLGKQFRAEYNTRKRDGWIEIANPRF